MNESIDSVKSIDIDKLEKVSTADLEELKMTKNVGDAVELVDCDGEVVVLLDDIDGDRHWQKAKGRAIEEVLKLNEWYKDGQRKFRNDAAPREFLDQMREVLLAISVLSNFYEWTDDIVGTLIDNAIVKLAFVRYCQVTEFKGDISELEHSNDFAGYVQMVTVYAKTFTDIVVAVRQSAEQTATDISNLPE